MGASTTILARTKASIYLHLRDAKGPLPGLRKELEERNDAARKR